MRHSTASGYGSEPGRLDSGAVIRGHGPGEQPADTDQRQRQIDNPADERQVHGDEDDEQADQQGRVPPRRSREGRGRCGPERARPEFSPSRSLAPTPRMRRAPTVIRPEWSPPRLRRPGWRRRTETTTPSVRSAAAGVSNRTAAAPGASHNSSRPAIRAATSHRACQEVERRGQVAARRGAVIREVDHGLAPKCCSRVNPQVVGVAHFSRQSPADATTRPYGDALSGSVDVPLDGASDVDAAAGGSYAVGDLALDRQHIAVAGYAAADSTSLDDASFL